MKIVQVEVIKLKDIRRGIRKGQIGTVIETLENGAMLVDIPKIGMVTLFADQVTEIKDA